MLILFGIVGDFIVALMGCFITGFLLSDIVMNKNARTKIDIIYTIISASITIGWMIMGILNLSQYFGG